MNRRVTRLTTPTVFQRCEGRPRRARGRAQRCGVALAWVLLATASAGEAADGALAPTPTLVPGCRLPIAPSEFDPDCILTAEPASGGPGSKVFVDGRCGGRLLHHRDAFVLFDCTTVAQWEFPGGDSPLARTITVPRCARPGMHVLQLRGPFVTLGEVAIAFAVSDAAPPCAGDCDSDGRVSVAELVTGTSIALTVMPIEECASFDTDGRGTVSVDELVQGLSAALRGCTYTGCDTPEE